MLGLFPIGAASIGGFEIQGVAPTLPPDEPADGIDAAAVPASRRVVFAGSIRVVRFEGSTRLVRFE